MLAVTAILALVMTFAVPNTGMLQTRRLDAQARELVAQLELARQRAVMTGTKHRLWIDLEEAAYRMAWFVGESRGLEGPARPPISYDVRGSTPLPLVAPQQDDREYRPVPGRAGDLRVLPEAYAFRGLQTDDGWIDRGEVMIVFDRDGTSNFAELVIEDQGGETRALEIRPLAEAVRVHREPV